MTRRHSSWIPAALDASFQIPLDVNSTSNNLLLEDDALEHDFFDGLDGTLSTPMFSRIPVTKPATPHTKSRREILAPVHPDTQNLDQSYDYAEEEYEVAMGNADGDGDTPRCKRVFDPIDEENTPKARVQRDENIPRHCAAASPSPTPISRSPKLIMDETSYSNLREDDRRRTSGYSYVLRTRSSSATPKPKRTLRASSRAPPSVHSTPVRATSTAPSSVSRPGKALLHPVVPPKPESYTLHHEHAPSVRDHSVFLSDLDSDSRTDANPVVQLTHQVAPDLESARLASRDPRMPEKSLDGSRTRRASSESSRARRLSTTQGTRSRPQSRTRNASPSSLTRAGHDAVMLPIQEEDEDLQDRGIPSPIPKPHQRSGSPAPRDTVLPMTKKGVIVNDVADADNRGKKNANSAGMSTSSTSTGTSSSKARASASPTHIAKRSGHDSTSQPLPKRRKTKLGTIYLGTFENPAEPSAYPHAAVSTPASVSHMTKEKLTEDILVNHELPTATLNAKPVGPDAHFLPSHSQSPIQPVSDLPTGSPNSALTRETVNETPDEVQDFLLRYAKKYGPAADTAAHTIPIKPNAPLSVDAVHSYSHPQRAVAPKRRDAASEIRTSGSEHGQAKVKRLAANPDRKGKIKIGEAVPKKGDERVPAGDVKNTESHSILPPSGGASNNAVLQEQVALEVPEPSHAPPDVMSVDGAPVGSRLHLIYPISEEVDPLPLADPLIVVPPSRYPSEVVPETASPLFSEIGRAISIAKEAEGWCLRVSGDSITTSSASSRTVMPEHTTASSEAKSKRPASGSISDATRIITGPLNSRDGKTSKDKPAEKLRASSAPQVTKRKESSEPRADDMFARKKRDSYLQKGLDLTAHSSRRHARNVTFSRDALNGRSQLSSGDVTNRTSPATKRSRTFATVCIDKLARTAVDDTTKTGSMPCSPSIRDPPVKRNDRATQQCTPSDLECKDHIYSNPCQTLYTEGSSKNRGKHPVKTDSRTLGDGDQKTKPESDRGRDGRKSESGAEDIAETSSSSIAGVLADRLVGFSQSIMGSFGLLSHQSETDAAERSHRVVNESRLSIPDSQVDRYLAPETRGTVVQHGTSHSTLAELSPRTTKHRHSDCKHDSSVVENRTMRHADHLHLHLNLDDSQSLEPVAIREPRPNFLHGDHRSAILDTGEVQSLKESRKRPAGDEPRQATGEGARNSKSSINDRARKRTRISRDGDGAHVNAAGSAASSNSAGSDKPRDLKPSRRSQMTGNPPPRPARRTADTRPRARQRKAEASTSTKPAESPKRSETRRRPNNPCSLTLPMAPAFSTDVLRQQRAFARAEQQNGRHENNDNSSKSDDRVTANSTCTKGRLSTKQTQTNGAWKPTVPRAFNFQTDTRLTGQRQSSFEAKLKTWEQRASEAASTDRHGTSHKILPDFKSMHAAQEANLASMAARRREFITPTIPVSPKFVVDVRLAERQKFEESRRAKEKEMERMLEEKRRARVEEEERDWREARKRTVPRANEVPQWYAEMPRRTERKR